MANASSTVNFHDATSFDRGGSTMRRIGAAIFFLTGMFGCAEKIEHDLELAAKRGVEFAEVAFVRRNLDKGYALLATKARSYVPIEKFNETVSEMHRSGYPIRSLLWAQPHRFQVK